MPAPTTNDELLELVRKSGVLDEKKLDAYLDKLRASGSMPSQPSKLAGFLVQDGMLTNFQAEQLVLGKWRRFHIGKYKVLERLGSGGMGSVFLCEHKLMRRRVAVKVLPTAKAEDPSSLERFYREARAVAALDHPNIVRAYDIDQDDNLHFLVMEYVDGASLQEIGKKIGPLDITRACQYMYQSAKGLQHAHETAGLVHRDIKPGNILVDRIGVVKILDMGLARFFHDEEDILTKKYDENVLGTADYLAPEQAIDSHGVDIRADVYSLGATFYFCLTGKTPFSEGTVAQKLIWHQTRQPKPIRNIRPEVPEEVIAIVEKMMAKEPGQRYQTPREVMEALEPWMSTPVPPPPSEELPRLCPAALGGPPMPGDTNASQPATVGMLSPSPRKSWQVSTAPTIRTPASPTPGTTPSGPRDKHTPAPPSPQGGRATLTKPAPPPLLPRSLKPVPRLGPNGQALKDTDTPAEESVAWERVAGETQKAAARTDTSPNGPRKMSSTSGLRPAFQEYRANERRRLLIVMAVVAGVIIIALTVTLILVLGGNKDKLDPALGGRPANTVYLSYRGKPGAATNLKDALRQAKAGYRIIVLDSPMEEEMWLLENRGLPKDITLEADRGTTVVWKLRRSITKPQTALLTLSHVDGFTLRGFAFDGGGRVKDLLSITGICPGLKIEDITLKDFERTGITFGNCQGTSERPVTIRNVHIDVSKPVESGFAFDLNPQIKEKDLSINKHILISKVTLASGTKFTKNLSQPAQPGVIDKTVILPQN
jgi:serine/threonine protein kinase